MVDKETKHVVEFEHGGLLHGTTWERPSASAEFVRGGRFVRIAERPWFAGNPAQVAASVGVSVGARRAGELANLFGSSLSGWHYLEAASDGSDEAAKIILGPLAAWLNERGLDFTHAHRRLPPDYLLAYVAAVSSGTVARHAAKELLAALLDGGERFDDLDGDSPLRRVPGREAVGRLAAEARFAPVPGIDIDALAATIIGENPFAAAKTTADPKIIHWLVGQVMKAARGKADAGAVRAALEARLAADSLAETEPAAPVVSGPVT